MAIRPFRVDIKVDVLTDLRERLKRTRWPDEIPGSGWDYGSNLAYVKELVDYWVEEFDWRKQEEVINAYSQYVAEVDGLDVHYIHEQGQGAGPTALAVDPRVAGVDSRVSGLHTPIDRPRGPRRRR